MWSRVSQFDFSRVSEGTQYLFRGIRKGVKYVYPGSGGLSTLCPALRLTTEKKNDGFSVLTKSKTSAENCRGFQRILSLSTYPTAGRSGSTQARLAPVQAQRGCTCRDNRSSESLRSGRSTRCRTRSRWVRGLSGQWRSSSSAASTRARRVRGVGAWIEGGAQTDLELGRPAGGN